MHPTTSRAATTGTTLALVLGLAACTGVPAGGGEEGEAAGDGTTVRYLVEELEDATAQDLLRTRLDVFEEENPGITVELETLPFDTMRTVLQTQLRSGDAPDVFNWGSGPSFGGALAEAGLVMDLGPAYEENGWEIYDFAKERVTQDGVVYGIPGEMETIGVYYNKDLFAELGIEEPTDLAGLEAAAQTVKDAGLIPFAVSDQEGWQGGHLLSMALSSRVGAEQMQQLVSGEGDWSSPEVVESLALWDRFEEQGFLTPFPTSVTYDSGNALFFSGEAAMVPTGSWLVDGIAVNADFEAGYIPFPSQDGEGVFSGGLGSGPMVSATTENEEAAVALVDFLASPEHGRWMVENLDVIPPFPVDTEGVDVTPLFAQVLEDVEVFAEGGSELGTNIDVLMPDEFNAAMSDGVQALFSDQSTPEEVAASLQEAAAR
ncbi:ABC transporter substrate-binding protein [Aquipuribacter hungaricus]|uniref:ABC transporter substrate-binding protein n=1 Tax=Aquipuribacter hungaricus TaxID=545624 RepID=A0ABV7WCN6_9MICO